MIQANLVNFLAAERLFSGTATAEGALGVEAF
jgi:hypothetical protein